MAHSEFCPYTIICPIYEEWDKKKKNKELEDVIIDYYGSTMLYACRARDELENKSPCSHITLLNLLKKLSNKK